MIKKIIALLLFASVAHAGNPQTGCNELTANQAQPHITINAADRCTTALLAGQFQINFASNANLTLSTAQWQYGTIVITDTGPVLSAARDVVYPNTDTFTGGTSRATFYFKNATAQTLTVKRSGHTGVAVAAGTSALLHHNGTDIESVTAGGGGGLTSPVGLADGGTGLTSAADDVTIVSNGTAWQAKSLPTCADTAGNHINYDSSTNTFSCGTTSSASSGAPTGASYITQTAEAGLSAEQALSALATGLVKNTTTTGVLSIGASSDVISMFSGTCTSSSSRYLATDGSCQLLSAGGDASTNTASSVDSEISLFSGTGGKTLKRATTTGILKGTSGVLSAATAGTDYYNPGGTDVSFADGGTGLSTASDDQTLVSSGSAWVAKTIPNCTDTGGNHINYTQSTNAFSCGTSGGGGTPGGSTTQVQYNNAGAFAGDADFAWDATNNIQTVGSQSTPGLITPLTPVSGAGANLTVRGGTGISNLIGGNLTIQGGAGGSGGGLGGNIIVQGGLGGGGAPDGYVALSTGGSERLTIYRAGDWYVNGVVGTSGNVLTSQGSGMPPVWSAFTPTSGSTGQTTVTQGDLLYGSAADTWSKLAKSATATRYLANTGTSNNPAWAQVNVANGVTGTLPQANRLRTVRTITAAGAVTGAATDEIICINKTSGAATTVNLHGSPATGFEYTIKDCKGDAATNNITITPAAGNVDGAGTLVINANYGKATIFYSGAGWFSE